MTEYKLVPVAGGKDIVHVTVPNDIIAYRELDAPYLAKNPNRCKKLLDRLSSVKINRAEDGSLAHADKIYSEINFDNVIYHLVDGGKRKAPKGLDIALELIKKCEIPKYLLAKQFR